jgi:hypothetical protein
MFRCVALSRQMHHKEPSGLDLPSCDNTQLAQAHYINTLGPRPLCTAWRRHHGALVGVASIASQLDYARRWLIRTTMLRKGSEES